MGLVSKVANANIGDIVNDTDLGAFWSGSTLNSNPSETRTGGDLFVSDSPETVNTNNSVIAYSPATGCRDMRIFFEHVNNTGATITLHIALRNQGAATAAINPATSGWTGVALYGSAADSLLAGRDALVEYLKEPQVASFWVNPNDAKDLITTPLGPGALYTGIIDFHSDKNIGVYVLAGSPSLDNPSTYLSSVAAHTRGTFAGSDVAKTLTPTYLMSHTGQATLMGIEIGPIEGGPIPVGTDQTYLGYAGGSSVSVATLKGAYGVRYLVSFPIYNDTGSTQCIAFVVTPRGGQYGGAVLDVGAGSVVTVPGATNAVTGNTNAVVISKTYVNPTSGITKRFMTLPSAAANLPIDFVAVPCS